MQLSTFHETLRIMDDKKYHLPLSVLLPTIANNNIIIDKDHCVSGIKLFPRFNSFNALNNPTK